jgi:transposase
MYDEETRARAVRLVRDHVDSQFAAIKAVAARLGMSTKALRRWVKQAEVDAGQAVGVTSESAKEIRELKRKNAELDRPENVLGLGQAGAVEAGTVGSGAHRGDRRAVRAGRALESVTINRSLTHNEGCTEPAPNLRRTRDGSATSISARCDGGDTIKGGPFDTDDRGFRRSAAGPGPWHRQPPH